MRVVIPKDITDDELIGWIKGYFAPSGVLGDIGDRLDVGRGDPNDYPGYHGFALIVPPGGISIDEIVTCVRESFLRPNPSTLVNEARAIVKFRLDGVVDLIQRLADEVERLQEFERRTRAIERSREASYDYKHPFGCSD